MRVPGFRSSTVTGALLAGFLAACTTTGLHVEEPLDAAEWSTAKARLYHRLSLQYLRAGDHDRARRMLTEAVQFDGRDVESLELLMRLTYGDGDLAAAGRTARLLLERDPGSVAALCTLGAIAEATHDLAAAELRYREALRAGPRDPRPWIDLHRFLLEAGRVAEAESLRGQLSARFPGRVEALLDHGAFLASAGRWSEAAAAYGDALQAQPHNVDAAARYALSALICDRPQAVLELGARMAPHARLDSPALTIALAVAHIKDRSFDAALQELDLLDEALRDHPCLSVLRGELLFRIGRLDRARTELTSAIELDPTLARAHAGLGRIHLMQGRRHAGIRALKDAVRLEPHNGTTHALLAASLAPDDAGAAREHLSRARAASGAERLIAEVERAFPELGPQAPEPGGGR